MNVLVVDYRDPEAPAKFTESLRTTGFGVLKNHPIPQSLVERELAHPGATEMRVVGSLHERKALMADLSDAFITLPGGMGTWEEVCEVLSWAQLGLYRKPCGLINVEGFYDPLIAMFDHAVAEGFLAPQSRALVVEEHDAIRLLDVIQTTPTPHVDRWIRPESR